MQYSFKNSDFLHRVLKLITLGAFDRVYNSFSIRKNSSKDLRMLDIGPGNKLLPDFENLNIFYYPGIDYIYDIKLGRTKFISNTFDIIHASHVLEHIPWYKLSSVLNELYRITKIGGSIEIHVPDVYKISKMIIAYENAVKEDELEILKLEKWRRFNKESNIMKLANGRIFSYGDGKGSTNHHNWHHSAFTEKFLTELLMKAGFNNIETLSEDKIRSHNHGWINLGLRAIKQYENTI
jgi:hypothetical protein